MIERKSIKDVKNVMIFLSDSLRWDYLPDKIKNMGLTIKSIASSNCTAPSLSSIVTGLYPFRNGVFTFADRLPKRAFNILNNEKYNTSFRTENTWTNYDSFKLNPIFKMLNQRTSTSLEKIKPPFIYIEDEKGGHCPYGWTEDDVYEEGDCISFFIDFGKKEKKDLIKRYRKGIERSVKEFHKRMDIIKDRGLEDETLIIFLSDHGELLGDYGDLVGHGNMLVPELIYIPITIIHPNIQQKIIENKIMRHVDIVPTLVDILGMKVNQEFDGHSIISKGLSGFGYNYWKFQKEKKLGINFKVNYEEKGIWDHNGGYVFKNNFATGSSFIKATYDLIHPESIQSLYLRGRMKTKPIRTVFIIPRYYSKYITHTKRYNNQNFSINDAKLLITQIENKNVFYDEKSSLMNAIKSIKFG